MTEKKAPTDPEKQPVPPKAKTEDAATAINTIPESGGRDRLDPTRFGDWEKNGRCVDF